MSIKCNKTCKGIQTCVLIEIILIRFNIVTQCIVHRVKFVKKIEILKYLEDL